MEPAYVTANRVERERLLGLLDRLTDEDLGRRLPNGLTVADVLAHLAFWDRYARDVLTMWQREGYSGSETHFDAVNSAVLMLTATIPPRMTVGLARDAAESVDSEAEAVPAELAQVIVNSGKLRTLERAQHRRQHVDRIKELLDAQEAGSI